MEEQLEDLNFGVATRGSDRVLECGPALVVAVVQKGGKA